MLKTRVTTALVFVPLLLLAIWVGNIALIAAVAFLITMSVYEYCRMLAHKNYKTNTVFSIVIALFIGLLTGYAQFAYLPAVLLLSFVIIMFLHFRGKAYALEGTMMNFAGTVYFALGFGSILYLRFAHDTWVWLLLAFFITWFTDIGAYAVGICIGKHKLAPEISPKKTVEGAIGGLLISILSVLIFGSIVLNLQIWQLIVIGLGGSVFAQVGDLLESMVKRWADVKDSGNILPGHGGIWDRFDSILLTAPYLCIVLKLFL